MKVGFIVFSENLDYDAQLVMQMHDEVIVEAKTTCVDSVLKAIETAMENVCPEFQVKLPIKLSIGSNWGAMKRVIL